MTQQEKDTERGRIFREIEEHEHEIRHPIVKLRSVAERLRAFADTLDARYSAMLEDSNFRSANVAGATVSGSFEDVANVEAISKLENDVREHGRALGRLYSDRSALN